MKKNARQTSVRLTPEAKELIERLSKKLGINQTSVIEMAIRVLAEKEKVIALEGFSSQLCKTFPKVELLFDAYGVSVSGEPTQFKISADCIPAQDPADIASINIPYGKLLNEKPRNAEFKFSGYQDASKQIL